MDPAEEGCRCFHVNTTAYCLYDWAQVAGNVVKTLPPRHFYCAVKTRVLPLTGLSITRAIHLVSLSVF